MVATYTYWERFCSLTLRPERRLVFLDSPSVVEILSHVAGSREENGLPRWCSGKESTANEGDIRETGLISGSGRSPGVGNHNLL